MYQTGDYIVKNGNGVCRVEKLVHLDFAGADRDKLYYLLIPVEDEKGKVYVPTDTTDRTVRKAMTKKEAEALLNRIPSIEEQWVENDKLREKRYKDAIKSNRPEELVAVIKMTYLRKKKRAEEGKRGTVVDERYFRIAENMLYAEIGFALGTDKDKVRDRIIEFCQQKMDEETKETEENKKNG